MAATSPTLVGTGTGPRMSRRHAAGAESARGLLFTVLGEFVLPQGGSAWTAAFIDVLGRLGIEPKAARQALMRTAADGWLTADRVGRRTRWRLTPSGERLLTEGTARIFGFSGGEQDWDGRWLLVLAPAPDTDRRARHLLRTRLAWAGFGSPSPGVWMSARLDRATEVDRILEEANLLGSAQVFIAQHRGGGGLARMVRQAWDLDAIAECYEEFLVQFRAAPAGDPLTTVIELVHAWRRFPSIDPALPQALLPTGWSGGKAATLFERQHARLAADARVEWRSLNAAAP